MDNCRKITDTMPPINSPMMFVKDDGTVKTVSGGKMTKSKALEILEMKDLIANGKIKVYILWIGTYSSDFFVVDEDSYSRFIEMM